MHRGQTRGASRPLLFLFSILLLGALILAWWQSQTRNALFSPDASRPPAPKPMVAAGDFSSIAIEIPPAPELADPEFDAARFPVRLTGAVEPARAPLAEAPHGKVGSKFSGPSFPRLAEAVSKKPASPRRGAALTPAPVEHQPELHSAGATPASDDVLRWPAPAALLEDLDHLAKQTESRDWARRASAGVNRLVSSTPAEAAKILRELRELADEANRLQKTLQDTATEGASLASDVRRARHALLRRLDIWTRLQTWRDTRPVGLALDRPDPKKLTACLSEVRATLGDAEQAAAWRDYLLLDELSAALAGPDGQPAYGADYSTAQKALARLNSRRLSPQQRKFLQTPPLARLSLELRRLTAEPVDARQLLEQLEQFESTGQPSHARLVSASLAHLSVSSRPESAVLARQLETHYRNANVRVAVSDELLSRLMPVMKPTSENVFETILGVPVRGRSQTKTDLSLRLLEGQPVRIQMEARGHVASSTAAQAGAVTTYNQTQANFIARKVFEVRPEGLKPLPTEVSVSSSSQLQDVQTNFDGIPLLGGLVRAIAQGRYERQADEAQWEAEQKLAAKARRRFDLAATPALESANQQIARGLLLAGQQLALDPRATVNHPSDQRLALRMRLAGASQLAANTPRPRALSDSLASVQIHQSALNNLLEQLELHGQAFTPRTFYAHVAKKLDWQQKTPPEKMSDEVEVQFAGQDPLRVVCENGKVLVVASLLRLETEEYLWRDQTVTADYLPTPVGNTIEFRRDQPLQLEGRRVSLSTLFILRGILDQIFSDDRSYKVLGGRLASDSRLQGLEVTQCEVRDGWIGLSLGLRRAAEDHVSYLPQLRR